MVLLKQNYNTIFGAFFAFLFLFSILVPFHPQNGSASILFEEGGEDSTAESTEEASTSNIEICDNLVDDDNDGLVDNQDSVDCPATPGLVPTPEPEEEEAVVEEEEPADEDSQATAVEICDNTLDDDGDGLVDTEDTEDCPMAEAAPEEEEEEAAPEEEEPIPTPTPAPEVEEEAAPEEEEEELPTPEPGEEEAVVEEEEPADEDSQATAVEICDNTLDDDGDGLVDTEDTEDCPMAEAAPEEEEEEEEPIPTPTPAPEVEEEAAPEEEEPIPTPTPAPEAEEEAAPEEEEEELPTPEPG